MAAVFSSVSPLFPPERRFRIHCCLFRCLAAWPTRYSSFQLFRPFFSKHTKCKRRPIRTPFARSMDFLAYNRFRFSPFSFSRYYVGPALDFLLVPPKALLRLVLHCPSHLSSAHIFPPLPEPSAAFIFKKLITSSYVTFPATDRKTPPWRAVFSSPINPLLVKLLFSSQASPCFLRRNLVFCKLSLISEFFFFFSTFPANASFRFASPLYIPSPLDSPFPHQSNALKISGDEGGIPVFFFVSDRLTVRSAPLWAWPMSVWFPPFLAVEFSASLRRPSLFFFLVLKISLPFSF